jgi:hypothetical protein
MGVKNMKRTFAVSLFVIAVLALMVGPVMATKPGTEPSVPGGLPQNPNGFPSGTHYNLNIIAKQSHFQCPPASEGNYLEVTACGCGEHEVGDYVEDCDLLDTCVATSIPIYGNVIFIPREQEWNPDKEQFEPPIIIKMESGKKGPKGKVAGPDILEVTDSCTLDDNEAVLRLPADKKGYAVYARILGKPGKERGEPTPTFTMYPDLFYAEDELGNDLLFLGLVTPDGTQIWYHDQWTLERRNSSSKGKGVQKADDITGLFLWHGDVCYLDPLDYDEYCLDDDQNNLCYEECWCCEDIYVLPNVGDGVCEHYVLGEWDCGVDPCVCGGCPDNYCDGDECHDFSPVVLWCRHYQFEWVFNIADFVGYLWECDNTTGAYHVQVRFYPLSQRSE